MALCPFHGRAEWEAMPLVDTSARRVPLQPPSTRASVGSSSTAKSASAMSSGRCSSTWSRPLYFESISSAS